MDEKKYQFEVLDQMIKNEEKLSELYGLYMQAFPEKNDFWNSLAQEEVGHANWIKTLREKVDQGDVTFDKKRFNLDTLNDFYKYIQKQEIGFSKDLTLVSALFSAKEIEETMLEKDFFKVFVGDGPELEILLLALEYSTKNHREIVNKAWQDERKAAKS